MFNTNCDSDVIQSLVIYWRQYIVVVCCWYHFQIANWHRLVKKWRKGVRLGKFSDVKFFFRHSIDLFSVTIERENLAPKSNRNIYWCKDTKQIVCHSGSSSTNASLLSAMWKKEAEIFFLRDEGPLSVIITVISVDERNSNWLNALLVGLIDHLLH